VAEELIFGKHAVTTGAQSDLQQATSTARNMITKYGMSDSIGPVYHSDGELEKLSASSREAIELEVRNMLARAEDNAKRILKERSQELHRLAKGLLEHETLDPDDIKEVLAGRPPKKKSSSSSTVGGGAKQSSASAENVKDKQGRKATIAGMDSPQQ